MANTKAKHGQGSNAQKQTPLLEWILGGIGVLLLTACVVFLVYEGMHGEETPGELTATVKEIVSTDGTHIVTFELSNAGTQTLSNVHVTARLLDNDREVERAQTVIDYLPGHSLQEGGFYFSTDPRKHELVIAPEGYQKP
jgi:uncharacterized protein (TIGR02588 family)